MKQKSKVKKRGIGLPKNAEAVILNDIRHLIETTHSRVASYVNTKLTMLYWRVGERIRREVLKEKRAEYGERIVATLSQQLTVDYGQGFSDKNMHHMVLFAERFSNEKIVSTLSRQLSWSHFKEIFYLEDELKRDFYAEMCRLERWSVRTLRNKIGGMLFERTALSKKPDSLIKAELKQLRDKDRLTPDLIFRDPYFLDFLGLKGTFQEKDLESAINKKGEPCLQNNLSKNQKH